MLGIGKWHKLVPRDPVKNLAYRRDLLRRAEADPAFQAALVEMCRQDILFYINSFVVQTNPLKKGAEAIGPFIIWDFQAEALLSRPEINGKKGFLWCYEHNQSAVLQKSRELGATWFFLILEDWLCMFQDNVQALNISKSADAVDCKSPNSLFWKIRFMHRHLPGWLKGPILEEKMYFGFERTGSAITGEASTGRAGVGGRAGIIFIDEVSKILEAAEVRQRTANTADCRFFNSTHEGTGTEFYKLCRTPELVQWTWHWSQHPEKRQGLYHYDPEKKQVETLDKQYQCPPDYNFVMDGRPAGGPYPGLRSPWYDRKCVEIGSERGAAVELDINPDGSVSQFFDPILLRQLLAETAREPSWQGRIEFDEYTGRIVQLVRQPKGPFKLWIPLDAYQRPRKSSFFQSWDISSGSGATPTCGTIFDGCTGEKVGQYADAHIKPERAGALAVTLAWLFVDEAGGGAKIAWEMQGPGLVFGERVVALGYGNIYMRTDEIRVDRPMSKTPGWVPTPGNKRRLLEDYRKALETREFLNPSEEALRECHQFRYDAGGNVVHDKEDCDEESAARVSHGDYVIADALAWKIGKDCGRGAKEKKEQEVPFLSLQWRRDYHKKMERNPGWNPLRMGVQ